MAELEVKGMQELVDKVKQLGNKAKKIENQALLKGAEPILKEAVSTTEFHDRTGRLRKNLKISRPKSKGDTKYVLVGIDKGDISEIFYGKFLEFGTSKMNARPFLGPAYESKKEEAKEIIKQELRNALNLK